MQILGCQAQLNFPLESSLPSDPLLSYSPNIHSSARFPLVSSSSPSSPIISSNDVVFTEGNHSSISLNPGLSPTRSTRSSRSSRSSRSTNSTRSSCLASPANTSNPTDSTWSIHSLNSLNSMDGMNSMNSMDNRRTGERVFDPLHSLSNPTYPRSLDLSCSCPLFVSLEREERMHDLLLLCNRTCFD